MRIEKGKDINIEFKRLISLIKKDGYESKPRNEKVKETFNELLCLDPTKVLVNFNSRKFSYKYFAGELAWYLKKERDINYISNFSKFWSKLTDENNEINSNYGNLLFGKQLKWAYECLKKDKNTRQAVAFVNRPKFQYEGNKDFPCTMYLNFFIRDGKLHVKTTMRSNDMFFGLTYDAPFISIVLQQMRLWLLPTYPELKLGTYFHNADNIHYYERHFEIADKIEQEKNICSPHFELKVNLFNFDENDDNKIIYSDYIKLFFNFMDYFLIRREKTSQEDYKTALKILLVDEK